MIEAVARECKRQGMKLGLYYSLWDRKVNVESDRKYNTYMLKQLDELMDITEKYTKIVEFWFDGSWVKPGYRWPVEGIYRTIKSREPQCQIGINWTIGEDVPCRTRNGHGGLQEKPDGAGGPARYRFRKAQPGGMDGNLCGWPVSANSPLAESLRL